MKNILQLQSKKVGVLQRTTHDDSVDHLIEIRPRKAVSGDYGAKTNRVMQKSTVIITCLQGASGSGNFFSRTMMNEFCSRRFLNVTE